MISAYYVVKNEEEFIQTSLESLLDVTPKLISHIAFIDTGSTDHTQELITETLRKFDFTNWSYHYFAVEDFSTKGEIFFRCLGLALCTDKWVMPMDGDQVMSVNWAKESLKQMMKSDVGMICAKFREHVGSYEYFNAECLLKEKEILFRNHSGLRLLDRTGNKHQTHCTMLGSEKGSRVDLKDVYYLHYAYAKKDLVKKFQNNNARGDYGNSNFTWNSEQDVIKQNLGFKLSNVDYSIDLLPASMRVKFGNTYRLEFNNTGHFIARESLCLK